VQSPGTPSANAPTPSSVNEPITKLRKIDIGFYKKIILNISPLVSHSGQRCVTILFCRALIRLSRAPVAYENIALTWSHARRSRCDDCPYVGTNRECVACGNSFASPHAGRSIAGSTPDSNSQSVPDGVSNYVWCSDIESVNYTRARRKGQAGSYGFT
jgi:hypothetical protein